MKSPVPIPFQGTDSTLKFKIALTMIPGVGPVLAKNLLAYLGSAEAVFKEKKGRLQKVPGVGAFTAAEIFNANIEELLERAEEEIEFIERSGIQPLFFSEPDYPWRLKQCEDSPVMLYSKGTHALNNEKVLAVIGTRKSTPYGRDCCEKMIGDLASLKITIVSGMAYGIDVIAHEAALANQLPTCAVLAHGLDMLYPSTHLDIAKKMLLQGGLLTEYMSKTKLEKDHFPNRNRIVAGISDAVLVIESGEKGGSLITAEIANSYNRDVFAVPGRKGDPQSAGCNNLIRRNKAALVESAEHIAYLMGWDKKEKLKAPVQKKLFPDLSPEEKKLMDVMEKNGKCEIDFLCRSTLIPVSKVSSLLLTMEFAGMVRSLPGKVFELA